jgi:hypothetical protein
MCVCIPRRGVRHYSETTTPDNATKDGSHEQDSLNAIKSCNGRCRHGLCTPKGCKGGQESERKRKEFIRKEGGGGGKRERARERESLGALQE